MGVLARGHHLRAQEIATNPWNLSGARCLPWRMASFESGASLLNQVYEMGTGSYGTRVT